MADYAITASSVVAATTASTGTGTAGATIAAGDVLYEDAADAKKLKLADADAAATAAVKGIALHGAASGQPVTYIRNGDLTLTITSGSAVGDYVVASATAGKMAPVGDLGTGKFPTGLGWLISATVLRVSINASGIAKA